MNKTPMDWGLDSNLPQKSNIESNEKASAKDVPPIYVGNESNISVSGGTVEYDSGSRVWLPYPTYRIPNMAVLSYNA